VASRITEWGRLIVVLAAFGMIATAFPAKAADFVARGGSPPAVRSFVPTPIRYWIIRPPFNSPDNVPTYVGSPLAGTNPVRLGVASPSPTQNWTLAQIGLANLLTYQIVNRDTGLCMAVHSPGTATVGGLVYQAPCRPDSDDKKWRFYNTLGGTPRLVPAPLSNTNLYRIVNYGSGACLGVPAYARFSVNTALRHFACPGDLSYRWRVPSFLVP
jgi:hypothetical protein